MHLRRLCTAWIFFLFVFNENGIQFAEKWIRRKASNETRAYQIANDVLKSIYFWMLLSIYVRVRNAPPSFG